MSRYGLSPNHQGEIIRTASLTVTPRSPIQFGFELSHTEPDKFSKSQDITSGVVPNKK